VSNDWGPELIIEYDANGDLLAITGEIRRRIEKKISGPVNIIGHSLGGVIGVAMANQGLPVNKIATMASPFGGIGSWWPPKTIGSELRRVNKFTQTISVPHQFYVSTSGHNPWFVLANDGVVPISSQKAISGANYIDIPSNHFEILLNEKVVASIKDFLDIKVV
jgi:triacylglycerol esterase/lipase EstA (alpha/beta hydrolase family)